MISAVVLAAGLSTRMGMPKMLFSVEGRPMLEKVLEIFRRTMVGEVVVVLGAESSRVSGEVEFLGERVVINRGYRKGMSSSLKLGLARVSPRADAAMVALGDQPFLSPSTVDRIIEAFLAKRPPIVVPVYGRVRGNPVLFARSVFPDVKKIEGDAGARSVVAQYGDRVLEVPVRDSGVLLDIDTPGDYRRAGVRGRRAQAIGGPGRAPLRRSG